MSHPYRGLPPDRFWRGAVGGVAPDDFDPMGTPPFTIGRDDQVAAAGSCFAQHIARNLGAAGFHFLRTESVADFSAGFGNIYTARQLHQLMLRAYGLMRPADSAWQLPSGKWVDPFRPQMLGEGLDSAEEIAVARMQHLGAVREMFEDCAVFVFTLGLTEAWLAADGAALPVPPGVLGVTAGASEASFHNFSHDEVFLDLERFLIDLVAVNHSARVVLTVSPVALAATYEPRHVAQSNMLSKAALRLAAERLRSRHGRVCYFPSFEIITAPQNIASSLEPDLRAVSDAGVARVMAVFNRHMLGAGGAVAEAPPPPPAITAERRAEFEDRQRIICDEDLLAS